MADQSGKYVGTVSTISAILLAWIGYNATKQRDAQEIEAKNSQMALDRTAEERQRIAGEREVNLKVYEVVVNAIQEGSERRQEIARSLVYAMVADTSLQQGFLEALRAEGVASVQRVVARDFSFDDSTRQARAAAGASPAAGGVSRLDLFWCEGSGPPARDLMESVKGRLTQAGVAESGVRVRMLPTTVNARPGYHVSGYQVRFESVEQTDADKVRAVMRSALPGAGPEAVVLRLTTTPTPGYVSAFACP
jgi:hypothetical protein